MLLNSNKVFVFPNTLRNQNHRVFNEQNMIKYGNRHDKDSYVISHDINATEHNFKFLLKGYLFDIQLDATTVADAAKHDGLFAHIVLSNIAQGSQSIQQLYGKDDADKFTGLDINYTRDDNTFINIKTTNDTIYTLQLLTPEGNIPTSSLRLEVIDGGTC